MPSFPLLLLYCRRGLEPFQRRVVTLFIVLRILLDIFGIPGFTLLLILIIGRFLIHPPTPFFFSVGTVGSLIQRLVVTLFIVVHILIRVHPRLPNRNKEELRKISTG